MRTGDELAGDPGFEPGHTDPESAVLPLDESPVRLHYSIASQQHQFRCVVYMKRRNILRIFH